MGSEKNGVRLQQNFLRGAAQFYQTRYLWHVNCVELVNLLQWTFSISQSKKQHEKSNKPKNAYQIFMSDYLNKEYEKRKNLKTQSRLTKQDLFRRGMLIGHVNIEIIFSCIGNSQWCLFNLIGCSKLSQEYCRLIGWYWKIIRKQLCTLTCPIRSQVLMSMADSQQEWPPM